MVAAQKFECTTDRQLRFTTMVTEYVVATLEGLSTVERAHALIGMAAPQFGNR